jgi:hypothetical protein
MKAQNKKYLFNAADFDELLRNLTKTKPKDWTKPSKGARRGSTREATTLRPTKKDHASQGAQI